jgi:hypothetical protein
MYTRGKTSLPSVLPCSYERCDPENTLYECFQNVSSTFSERFVNIFRTFVNIFRTFCQHFQNVCQHFQNVLSTFSERLSTFSERFVNIFRTFCQRFPNRSENVHTVRILCIVRKLLTRPFQRHLT